MRSPVKTPDWVRTRPWPPQVPQVVSAAPPAEPVPLQSEHALERLFEGDFHVETKIGTLAGGPRPLLGPMATEIAEHFIEDICKSRSETAAESTWTTTSPPCPGGGVFESGVAETVVGGPFLVVLEDLIGLGKVLEFFFGLLVSGVLVRMEFHRQLAVGLLDILRGGVAADPECRVIVLFSHQRGPSKN